MAFWKYIFNYAGRKKLFRMKVIAKLSLKFFVKTVAAAFFGLLILVLLNTIVNYFFKDQWDKRFVASAMKAIACTISSMLLLFALCIKDGYDDAKAGTKLPVSKNVVAMIMAVLYYCLITIIIRYRTLGAATNVIFLANAIAQSDDSINDIVAHHGWIVFVSLIIQTIPFIPAMLFGYLFGSRRRGKSRHYLTGNQDE